MKQLAVPVAPAKDKKPAAGRKVTEADDDGQPAGKRDEGGRAAQPDSGGGCVGGLVLAPAVSDSETLARPVVGPAGQAAGGQKAGAAAPQPKEDNNQRTGGSGRISPPQLPNYQHRIISSNLDKMF